MGGPIAISLIDKIKNQKIEEIKVKGLFYLEGNLDKNDAFFSDMVLLKKAHNLITLIMPERDQ